MGKGSARRPGEGYAANWDAIFGQRKSDEGKGRVEPVPEQKQKNGKEQQEAKEN